MTIPYFATLRWMREAFTGCVQPLSNRLLTRVELSDNVTLSVPVAGGASALKRLHFNELKVSDHGRWNSVHERALEAAFSRTPFFRHIFPEIYQVLNNPPETVADLNRALHEAVVNFIHLDKLRNEFEEALRGNPAKIGLIAREMAIPGGDRIPFFAHVCRLGPDAIFMLAPTL